MPVLRRAIEVDVSEIEEGRTHEQARWMDADRECKPAVFIRRQAVAIAATGDKAAPA